MANRAHPALLKYMGRYLECVGESVRAVDIILCQFYNSILVLGGLLGKGARWVLDALLVFIMTSKRYRA